MNRRHRLRGRGRVAAVRRTGSEGRCGLVRVRAANNELAWARVALAVHGATGSVQRNRVRRRVRAAVASRLEDVAGLDVVVAAPAAINVLSAADLEKSVACALEAAARRTRS